MMKKLLCLLLSVAVAVSTLCFGISAYAANEPDIKSLTFGTTYTESASKSDYYDDVDMGNGKTKRAYYDMYQFDVPADGKVTLKMSSKQKGYFDINYTLILLVALDEGNDSWYYDDSEVFPGKVTVPLKKGSYMLTYSYSDITSKKNDVLKGDFTFSLSYRPTFKNTTLTSVKAGKKFLKAAWKKQSGVTGYQIQYSTDKNFKKNTHKVTVKGAKYTSKTVKKLKSKKTYYVRVRTYKKTGGKTYYGKWSKAKSVKVK